MARLGEGDPRWINEIREDGKNVNNWHWNERDVTKWSVETLEQLFKEVVITDSEGKWKISKASIDGDSTINVRKGKIKYIYDLEFSLTYEGEIIGDSQVYNGTIRIPEFSYEVTSQKISCEVSSTLRDENSRKVAEHVKKTCKQPIQALVEKYLTLLAQECTQGLMLPQKQPTTPSKEAVPQEQPTMKNDNIPVCKKEEEKYSLEKILISEEFSCEPQTLYEIFLNQDKVKYFTQSAVEIDAREDGDYSLMDKHIVGRYIQLVPGSKIVKTWRFSSWPAGHYSKVVLTFESISSGTKLVVEHTNVPNFDDERVRNGWNNFFFKPIKHVFGFHLGKLY